MTLPSHTSLLTGLLPLRHGVRDNIGYSVRTSERTLASRFKAAGYATGAAVSAFVLRHQTGIGLGFDFFDDLIEVEQIGIPVVPQLLFERLVKLLDKELEIAQIVARQQPTPRVLLRDQEIAHKGQDPMRLVPAHQLAKRIG